MSLTQEDIDRIAAAVVAKLPAAPASATPPTAAPIRLRGDAAAAEHCGYKSRRAFLAFTKRHRLFPIQEGRTKFWPVRDLDRALRPKPENPAVWRPRA